MKCARCGRPIRKPVNLAGMTLGSHCAALVRGGSPMRIKRAHPVDARQADLFGAQA